MLLTVGGVVAFDIAPGLVKNKADELPGAPRWWLEEPGDTVARREPFIYRRRRGTGQPPWDGCE